LLYDAALTPLHLGNTEGLPFPDGSFDLTISEYGASIRCDPYTWILEAARVLRTGGRLVMLCTGPEETENTPVTECFRCPCFGSPDDDSVEIHLGHCSGRGP